MVVELKSGVFPVRKETGQYNGLDMELRICELCGTEIEDEVHFLFRCPKLKYTCDTSVESYEETHQNFERQTDVE